MADSLTVWRLVPAKRLPQAFDEEPGVHPGARWSKRGSSIVYTSASQALGLVELAAYASLEQLPPLAAVPVTVPEGVAVAEIDALPEGWERIPAPLELQRVGTTWVEEGASAVLRVPSPVVSDQCNYLLNPAHDDYRRLVIGTAEALRWMAP